MIPHSELYSHNNEPAWTTGRHSELRIPQHTAAQTGHSHSCGCVVGYVQRRHRHRDSVHEAALSSFFTHVLNYLQWAEQCGGGVTGNDELMQAHDM